MRVVITGSAGFLGSRLAQAILDRGELIDGQGEARKVDRLVLVDVISPSVADARVISVRGDLANPSLIESVLTADTDSIFHLAAVVSGQAEAEFDAGMRVNVDVTRMLMERCRKMIRPPKFVFTSSLAVFGGVLPDPILDDSPTAPQTSYGTQKAMAELLLYDATRKGFMDGRSLRLPTVTVRPGKPNRAASSFASGIIREPLAGIDAICPVMPNMVMWVTSPQTVIRNLIIGHDVSADQFRKAGFEYTRSVNVPGLRAGVGEMIDALRRVAGNAAAARVTWQLDPLIHRIVASWPCNFAPVLGPALGMSADRDFEQIIRQYMIEDGY